MIIPQEDLQGRHETTSTGYSRETQDLSRSREQLYQIDRERWMGIEDLVMSSL